MKKTMTDCSARDEGLVQDIEQSLRSKSKIADVANFLKIISDPTRMKILMILENHEVSVNDIAVIMNMTKSAISHQLKVLREAEYVKDRRDGKNKYYTIYDRHITEIIKSAYDHVNDC